MFLYVQLLLLLTAASLGSTETSPTPQPEPLVNTVCGCKMLRPCYMEMLNDLTEKDEVECVDDMEIGTSTYMVYFKAIQRYCGEIFNVTSQYLTSESRNLYEVTIHLPKPVDEDNKQENVPIILVEAGQNGGLAPVRLALSLIERLTACEENEAMIQNIKWVLLPCTNPDGLEYVRFDRPDWEKNTRKTGNGASYGIDISRNFDVHWNECEKVKSMLDVNYPGPSAASEIETRFIRNTLMKYKDNIKSYVSLRRRGTHGILYPHAFSEKSDDIDPRQVRIAAHISMRVNQRGGSLQAFVNDSIFKTNGKPVCGNSVDYAHSQGIQMPFEYRVGFDKDLQIISRFQYVPAKPTMITLRQAYFAGIRELHAILTNKNVHI